MWNKSDTQEPTHANRLSGVVREIWNTITEAQAAGWRLVMGIVNITPDSFSDGGAFLTPDAAVAHAVQLAGEGADIIDIGGESTRPGAVEVAVEEELRRVIPVIEGVRKVTGIPISIDTRKAEVAREACRAGANMVNDVSALRHDPVMAHVVHEAGVPVALMHMLGTPETMQSDPLYADTVNEVIRFLRERIAFCHVRGIEKILVDPGIGFGKLLPHNIALLKGLAEFRALEVPILLGVSRKRFIGELTGADVPADRLGGSVAAALLGAMNGATILRVHDVRATVDALKILDAVSTPGETIYAG